MNMAVSGDRRQETCFARLMRHAPVSKDGLLGKFPERTQTVILLQLSKLEVKE